MQQAGGPRWFEARYESVERREDGKWTKKIHQEERERERERERRDEEICYTRAHLESYAPTRIREGTLPPMVSLSHYFRFLSFLHWRPLFRARTHAHLHSLSR